MIFSEAIILVKNQSDKAICILYAGTKDAELLKFLSLSPESRQLSWIEQ